jgi:GntR family transcriptional regulator, transcriptional repressor for pyruvate dehydrogenase complex
MRRADVRSDSVSIDQAGASIGKPIGQVDRTLFERVAPGRVSTLIVEQILRLIQTQHLEPGDRLPSERELCTLLGASRTSVREAVRVLESRGLLEVRVGAKGGAHVASPAVHKASQGFSDMLATSAISAKAVTESRMIIELGAIPLICERATADDIAKLRELCVRYRKQHAEGTYSAASSAEFHLALLDCARNPALSMVGYALREPLQSSLDQTQGPGTSRAKGTREHEQIVDAIEARDPELARSIMAKHLGRTLRRSSR